MVARLLGVVAKVLLGGCYCNRGSCYAVTRWLVVVTDGHYVAYIEFLACC